jgi:deazaflavin-dependent oxidoreductase (nitroreductase family)
MDDRSVIIERLYLQEDIMSTPINKVHPPRGVVRTLYRVPIWIFRLHLGWLLMKHFLLLTHIGRKSGLPRQTILEVLQYDQAKGRYVVFAGWGEQSDWVKNIEKTPQAVIQVGQRPLQAQAVRLSPEEAESIILAYARQHPYLIRVIPRLLLGYRMDGTEEDVRALAHRSTVIAFDALPV